MPTPENNREILSLNSVPAFHTVNVTPAIGAATIESLVGVHDMVTIIQIDIRPTGANTAYRSIGGGSIVLADGDWAYLPAMNALGEMEVITSGGSLDIVLWGAKKDQ